MYEIVTRLLVKKPNERYTSASEVLEHCLLELQEKRVPDVGAVTAAALRPAAPPATASSSRSLKMVALVIVMLLIGLGITESTGLTHLMSGATSTTPASKIAGPAPEAASTTEAVVDSVPAPSARRSTDGPPLAVPPFDADQSKQHQQAWADYLGVAIEKDVTLGQNPDSADVKLAMVLIPPIEFMMGTDDVEKMKWINESKKEKPNADLLMLHLEGPQHFVRITRPFWLSKYEFSTGQFRQFVEATDFRTDAETNGLGGYEPLEGRRVNRRTDLNWDTLGNVTADYGPVVNVSWNDAAESCQWISSRHPDVVFSLPTKAQWEYACRAGTTTPWYSSITIDELQQYAQFEATAIWIKPAGPRKPNAFGLHDMHGNVREWCNDLAKNNYYRMSPTDDPSGTTESVSKIFRLVRGGSFLCEPRNIRSAKREFSEPANCFF